MGTSHSTQQFDEENNMCVIKKRMYPQICCCFRRKRSCKLLISYCINEGFGTSKNDFWLQIRQFEQIYNVCLDRRKTHEQWILHLRYPDKSSKEYLEYLQDCVYYNEDILPWPENALKDKYFYERLVCTIGTEMHIHIRQRLLIIEDMMGNLFESDRTRVSSGSLAEGLDLPGSDLDIMYVMNDVDVIQVKHNDKHSIQNTTLVIELDNDHPGYTRLRLIADMEEENDISKLCESTTTGEYVSVKAFLHIYEQRLARYQLSSHGPCFSDTDRLVDLAIGLRSKCFPSSAIPWVRRHRKQWPSSVVIDQIVQFGCIFVPIGPRNVSDNNFLWRLSFSVGEKKLIHSFNYTQLLCYGLLKLTLKRIINTHDDVKDLLCSYFLKTVLFWVSEQVDIETFQLGKLFHCFYLCLDKLISWIKKCYCPNYFIPRRNNFLGKINQSNNKNLQSVLESIKCIGIDGLRDILFPVESGNCLLLRTEKETLFIMLDFFVFKTCRCPASAESLSHCYKLLKFAESLQMSELSTFVIDICKFYYGLLSQCTAQYLPPPTTRSKIYNIHKLYHRHLKDGTRTDAVSGWLLYASYFYVIGHYNITLRLTEYVKSRLTQNVVYTYLGCEYYNEVGMNYYKNNVHSKLTFMERLKFAVDDVVFVKQSSLIPEELQLEVKDEAFSIPPVVLTYCLRFLCNHHLGDNRKKEQALFDLCVTVRDRVFVSSYQYSDALTILGVCMEIFGDTSTAHQYYDMALQCERVCHTTKARKSKLLSSLHVLAGHIFIL